MKMPKFPKLTDLTPRDMLVDSFKDLKMPEIEPVNFPDTIAETLKPVLDKQNETIVQLKRLYEQKQKECESQKEELSKSRKYNMIMSVVSIISVMIAICSLKATIVIGCKG